jgi:hypothetical protein
MLSGGNFHGQAVAMALDVLAIALTNLAAMSERRIDRLVHPDLNQGLPPFLTRDAGVNSGFMMAQVTAAASRASARCCRIRRASTRFPPTGTRRTWCRWRWARHQAAPRRAQRAARARDRADVRRAGLESRRPAAAGTAEAGGARYGRWCAPLEPPLLHDDIACSPRR